MTERSLTIGGRDSGLEANIRLGEVNPFSLVEAVNSTSEISHTSWLIFLAVVTYFCIAAAGVSHKDLLLNTAVALPIMQVSIDLQRFFLFAPIVLVFMHFGLLVQHVMLARKVMEFDAAVRAMEPTYRRTHPIRHELHSYFFTQSLAGPERSRVFGGFLHGMFWLSIVAIPVLVILFIQIVYLPYHDIFTTGSHRVALVLDIAILILMGVFLCSRSIHFAAAAARTIAHQPVSTLCTLILYAAVLLFSFFVATVPDEALDRFAQSLPWSSVVKTAESNDHQARVFALTDWFFGGIGPGSAARLFKRNLSVTDEVIVDLKTISPGQATVSLRNRDLRYAELDRSDLEQADFTGTDLTGARLVGANLKGARISCLDTDAVLTDPKLRSGNCANLTAANLTRADLSGADLRLVIMPEGNLANANLSRSDLRYSDLSGADLSGADLRGASIGGGVELMGANFLGANLGGADLKGAKIEGADFYGADLQGARLVFAQAQGASFQGAHLQGANFGAARLQGADFTDAEATGVDFGAAQIWITKPPSAAKAILSDVSAILIKAPSAHDLGNLKDLTKSTAAHSVSDKLSKLIERIGSPDEGANWNAGDEATAWTALKQTALTSDTSARRDKLAAFLGRLSCSAEYADGTVALGLIRRVVDNPQKSDPATLLKRLRSADCPSNKRLPESAILALEVAVEKGVPVSQDASADAPQSNSGATSDTTASTASAAVVPQQ